MGKVTTKHKPSFDEEKLLWQQGITHVAGVDEVGRGCFAGPVVAAAVVLPQDFSATDEINDSKVLSPMKREELAMIIKKYAIFYAIVEVSVPYINRFGIGKAGQLAFRKLVHNISLSLEGRGQGEGEAIGKRNTFFLVDGFPIQGLSRKKQKHIIKGDKKSISIAAASIIAKVYRDQLMQTLPKKYSHYGFAIHKGYGTLAHREAIKEYGLCDLHRTSFNLDRFL